MEKPKNWEQVEPAKEFGEYETLKLGGHICIIKSADEYTGFTGNTSLRICVDIDGKDEQKGFYQKQYDNNDRIDKKWSAGATKYITLKEDEKSVSMFKGFITTLENSNPKFVWDFDESKLVGLKLVGVFGQEEYLDNDGNTKLATRLNQFRSLDKLDDVKIPRVKKLDGSFVDYDKYSTDTVEKVYGNIEVSEDLPFDI